MLAPTLSSRPRVTIGLSPTFDLGPVTLAWHGVMAALGLMIGMLMAGHFARTRGLSADVVPAMALAAAISGLVGARLYYLAQEDPGGLTHPWSGSSVGFAFYGTVIAALPAVAIFLRVTRRPVLPNLDVLALAFPVGMAIGRLGDLINGEHYGPRTSLPWGVSYTDSASHAPEAGVAYHSGALYESVAVALLAFVLVVGHHRFRRPGDALWFVLGAYSAIRFVVFFWVSDVDILGLGLRQAQWTSIALATVASIGWGVCRTPLAGARRAASSRRQSSPS